MSGAAIALIILAVVAVLGFGGCLLCVGGAAFIGSQHDATVNCERANFGSVTCTVIHTRGTGAAEVCWDMKLVCNAGIVSQARACQTVAEKGFTTKFVPSSSFPNSSLCGPFATMTTENISAKGQ
jgi:hypothetical protein